MANNPFDRLRSGNLIDRRRVLITIVSALAGAFVLFSIGMALMSNATRETGNGQTPQGSYGQISQWEDTVNGVTCYTRTSPSGFSCVKTGQ